MKGLNLIDIVIVAYRSEAVLRACVASLKQDSSCGAIHVVNNSPDFPLGLDEDVQVRVLSPGRNIGFGAGVNLAKSRVESDIVAIVNPDTVMTDDATLSKCERYLADNPRVAIVSPRVFVRGALYRTSEREVSTLRYLAHPLGLDRYFGVQRALRKHRSTHHTHSLNGAFLVARRSVMDEVDWFDDSIFLFGEEVDLCRRIRRAGYKVSYLAEGHVDHVDGHSAGLAPFDIDKLRRSGRIEQLRRARGPARAWLYRRLLSAGRRSV